MSYGFCPICGAPGKYRERRPDGDDTCENGHKYKSSNSTQEGWLPLQIKTARRVMREVLAADADLKMVYAANISMCMYDELHARKYKPKLRKEDMDAISERILDTIFG